MDIIFQFKYFRQQEQKVTLKPETMGYSQEHTDQTRKRILQEAGRLMRKHGKAGVSIAEIMSAANLTHGGFYAHFKSKEQLFDAMVAEEFDFTNQLNRLIEMESLDGQNRALMAAAYYLNQANSEKVAQACTLASSSQDVARSNKETKTGFTRKFKSLITAFVTASGKRKSQKAEATAMAAIATCVGGLVLSRALNDQSLSQDLLKACIDNVERGFS